MRKNIHHLFRGPALDAYNNLSDDTDPVLRNGLSWTVWIWRILMGCLLVAMVFSLVAKINTYADGVGFVRLAHNQHVVAKHSGVIEKVHVANGDWVEEGQLIFEFYAREEKSLLAQAEDEYAAAVRRWLFDPAARNAVVETRNQQWKVRTKYEERLIRASTAGIIRDIRVRPGQQVNAGQILVTQGEEQGAMTMTIFLPGQVRPQLAVGQTVTFEPDGHRYAQITLELSKIGSELIGVGEARGQIGYGLGDVLALSGPLVRAEAQILNPYFELRGERYALHEGMTARAQVILESEPLALSLLPDFRTK